MKKLFTYIIVVLASITIANAQWSGVFTDDAYLKGNKTEVGISNCGSFGSRLVPALILGYHPNVPGRGLGFVADAGSNGWSIAGPGGLPPYCGDYFLPGSPVEGFSVQIGLTNYRNFNNSGICDFFDMAGGMICYSATLDRSSATWQSSGLVGGSLRVTNTTYVPDTSLFFVTQVKLCNESVSTVNDVYYLRHLDPDNDQPWSAYSGSFTTRNETYSQGSDTTPGLVTATSRSGCYLGLGSEAPTSRVTMGGFAPPTRASDVWNGIAPYNGTVGLIRNADEAISIAFKFLSIAPGTCECFGYAHVLNLSDLTQALALTASNVAVYEDTTNITDTLTKVICIGDSVSFKAVTTCTDFYSIRWTSDPPGSIVGSSDYDSLKAIPRVTTVYTLTGIGPCGGDTFNITVIVDTFATTLALSPADTTICLGASAALSVTGTGSYTYTWSPGSGLSSTSSGAPIAGPTSTTSYAVTVTSTLAGCRDTLYSTVRIDTLVATAGRDSSICPGREMVLGGSRTSSLGYPVSWTSVPSGGLAYLSSPSDTNPTLIFPLGEPAGSFTYSLLSFNYGCIDRDTIVVSVSASPAITIGLDSIYCLTSPSDVITCTPYGGMLSGPGIIDSTFHPSIAGIGGPYRILYSVMTLAGCISVDSAFTVVDSFPLARFIGLSSVYCIADSSSILVGAPGGGVFSGPGVSGNRFFPSLAGFGGPYNIRYTYTNPISGCTDDTVQTVSVISLPVVSFTGLDSQYCLSAITVTLTGSPAGGTFSGPGMSGSVFSPSAVGLGGPYMIIYTYSTGATCTGADTQYVTVNTGPAVSFTGLAASYCIYQSDAPLTGIPAGGVFSGPGISGSSFSPATAGIGGPYAIVYNYTNASTGCSSTDTQYVTVNPIPAVTFTGLSSTYCVYDPSVVLTGSPSGGIYSGTGISGSTFSPSIAGAGGPYSIIYTYTDTNSCVNRDTNLTLVNPRPTVSFTGLNTQYCFYEVASSLTGSPLGGTYTGTGMSGNVFTPSTSIIGGPYSIVYNYTDSITGCTNADTQLVTVNARPVVSFTGLASNYCLNNPSATLIGVPAGGVFSGTGVSGSSFSPSSAGSGGPYMITYSYTNPSTGCSNIDSQYVSVNPLPAPSFIGLNSAYCVYEPAVTLTGSPIGGTFIGAGISGTIFTPSAAGVGGPYRILYSYTDAITGCTNVDSQFTTINPRPTISIIGLRANYCIDATSVTLSATPAGGTFSGPGITGTTFDPRSLAVGGPYYIIYSVTDPITGCFNKDSVATRIDALPTPYFTGLNPFYCLNAPAVVLTGIPTGGTFSGTGMTSGGTFTPSAAGVGGPYTITYLYTDINGCMADTTRSTTVNPLPIANAGLDDTICFGSSTVLTATGGINYAWSPGGGLVASITVAPTVNTTYTVTVTDANSCSASDNVTISVKIITMIFATTDITCYGANDGTATVTAISGLAPYTYLWSDPLSQTTATATNLAPGVYRVTLTDAELCSGVDTVRINEPPILFGSVVTTNVLCYGDSNGTAKFTAVGGTPSYSYRTTLDGIYYYLGQNIIGLTAGIYTTEVSDANGCIVTISFTITQPTPIIMSYQEMQPRCYGYTDGSIFVLAIGGTPIYTMQMDDVTNTTGWFVDLSAGPHALTITDANGCKESYTLNLAQPAPIIVDINPDTLLLDLGETGQLFTSFTGAPADSVIFLWNTLNGINCTDCPNPLVSPYLDQVYEVTVIDVSDPSNPNPCTGTAIGYVFVGDGDPIYIPNAFTPNGDGANDFFAVYGKSLKTVRMQIFDRWGELLFESYNQDNGWDGTYKGENLQPGVYVYKVTAAYLNGKTIDKTGSVTLIR